MARSISRRSAARSSSVAEAVGQIELRRVAYTFSDSVQFGASPACAPARPPILYNDFVGGRARAQAGLAPSYTERL